MTMSPSDFLDLKLGQAARKGGIITETVTLTPALAQELLNRNTQNRTIKARKVSSLERDITANRWAHNGETIVISDTGELNDGQHRCQAVINTGKSITTEISFGAARDTRKTLDMGASRSASDILRFENRQNSFILAGMSRLIIGFENTLESGQMSDRGFSGMTKISSVEIEARASANDAELLDEAASFAASASNDLRGRLVPSMIGFSYWLLAKANPVEGPAFMERLAQQNGTGQADPEWHLFRTLASKYNHKRPTVEVAEAVVRAYNLSRQGKVGQKSSSTKGFIPLVRG